MKLKDKLHAYWSRRERDIMLSFPCGLGTKSDAHWLSGVLNKDFTDELERRGYDTKTLRFSVEPQNGNGRFSSQGSNNPDQQRPAL